MGIVLLSGCVQTRAPAQSPVSQATPEPEPEPEPEGDDTVIAILADEQRERWSAQLPEAYEGVEAPFSLDEQNIVQAGETVYLAQNCAICHGWTGEGDGPFSPGMNPRPIDLTDAVLMSRLGNDYLFWRLSEGGLQPPFLSAMPAFEPMLTEEERWQTIAYLRSIGTEPSEEEIVLVGGVDFQVGINLLQTHGCFACHRYNERGNFVGPDLQQMGAKYSREYLHRSLVDPSADIPAGFTDTMPQNYEEIIPSEDLELLTDFLAGSVGDLSTAASDEPEEPQAEAEAETDSELVATSGLPFDLSGLATADINGQAFFLPPNLYNIFINYELGMHCVGFNMSYCCVIPPYNSIQAQAVRGSSVEEPMPKLLSPDDGVALKYGVDQNTYSEGDKMQYWSIAKDVNGDGDMNDPGDNFANYVWTHLYIYEDLEGSIPDEATEEDRLHVGQEIRIQKDHGPSGMPMEGFAVYADEDGGNVVFTDSRYGNLSNIPLILTASHLWDALGLPLTAFDDGVLGGGSHRTIDETHFQPYQYSRVTMHAVGADGVPGDPMEDAYSGDIVSFIGTNPVDIPNCVWCHSSDRANRFGQNDYSLYQTEYDYWVENYPDVSDYMARLSASMIGILEMHDDKHDTDFLAEYDPDAATNRLGSKGPVHCADCHGDNVQGRLRSTDETPEEPLNPLTESIHMVHLAAVADEDDFGRTQSCQTCHPTHMQNPDLNISGTEFSPINQNGTPRFSDGDIRKAGGGCYLRRDAHANPDARPPFFLNAVGEYLLTNVATVDGELRGLYCTNCHNHNAQALYHADTLVHANNPGEDETLRSLTLEEIALAVTGSDDVDAYADYYLDPKVGGEGNPLVAYYKDHVPAALPEVAEGATYADASAGEDWWLSASEPHCADCHVAPFVESMGGAYFPIDQQGKYSLFRYSKGHANIACQSCHESIHGLYSVRTGEGASDQTTHQQALQFSPDGEYTGPVTCVACHAVNSDGVPVQLVGTEYENDYWASVVLMHFITPEDGEQMTPAELVEVYPYALSREIVDEAME